MRALGSLTVIFAFCCYVPLAIAAEDSVTITSPADGAMLNMAEQARIDYEVTRGPNGDHTHLYVDGKEKKVLRQLKGSHKLDPLEPGKHEICIKLVNKGHTPIGVQQCINVSVK